MFQRSISAGHNRAAGRRAAFGLRSAAVLAMVAGATGPFGPSAAMAQNFLLLVADSAAASGPVRDSLLATGLVTSVDIYPFSTSLPTPTLAELMMYDAVITWTNQSYADGAALGDVLADYVDAGRGVVCAVYCVSTTTANRSLTGRWQTGGYDIIPQRSGNLTSTTALGTVHLPGHALWNGLTGFTGSTNYTRSTTTGITAHGVRVADWGTGQVLAATSSVWPNRVDLGIYPIAWHSTPDGARLLANALIVAATGGSTDPGGCCLPDGTCQIVTASACIGMSGSFRGPNTDCIAPCPQPGSCCFPSGACEIRLEASCASGGGSWGGAASTCSPNPCAQPPTGACCTAGGCIIVWEGGCVAQNGVYQGDNSPCLAGTCESYRFEAEPNNTKLEANMFVLEPGNVIVGTSTASTGTADPASPDYFLVQTASAPLGIYRHRLTLNNQATPGNSAWIRGLTQSAAAPGPWPGPVGSATTSESTGQAHWLDSANRINIWYGFGRQEQVYYRVSGLASTTGQYMAIFDTTPIVPTDLGTFSAGAITINTGGQGHTNDTHVRIWDADFSPIHGYANDGASTNGGAPTNLTTTSFLRREFPAGTYYMGIAMGNLATNQGSPCDDNVRTGPMMDFADVAVDTGTQIVTDVSFSITDSAATTPFVASRGGRGEIAWFRFTVTGTIGTGACCFGSGACDVLSAFNCLAQSGTYQGDNTTCTVNPCPQPPTGACCFNDGTCAINWVGGCTAAGGTYMGDNTACGSVVCPMRLITGLPNNGLSAAGSGIFLDLTPSTTVPLTVPRLDYVASAVAGTATTVEIWTYPGPYLPQYGSSAGWTLHDTVNSISAGSSDLAPLLLNNPLILPPNQTTGVYLIAQAGGVRYTGDTGAQPVWADANLTLYSAHARTTPWGGTINTPRVFSGVVYYILGGPAPCYANCDNSTTAPILNVEDFSCFINEFASAQALPHEQQLTHYANCDQSTTAPVLNVEDFSCFINKFAQGCP
jgi:hypothetical protein